MLPLITTYTSYPISRGTVMGMQTATTAINISTAKALHILRPILPFPLSARSALP